MSDPGTLDSRSLATWRAYSRRSGAFISCPSVIAADEEGAAMLIARLLAREACRAKLAKINARRANRGGRLLVLCQRRPVVALQSRDGVTAYVARCEVKLSERRKGERVSYPLTATVFVRGDHPLALRIERQS